MSPPFINFCFTRKKNYAKIYQDIQNAKQEIENKKRESKEKEKEKAEKEAEVKELKKQRTEINKLQLADEKKEKDANKRLANCEANIYKRW